MTAAIDDAAVAALAQAAPVERYSAPLESPRSELAALRADPRQAVQEDWIRCLICGRSFRQLTNTHLRAHRSTPAEYKRRFGYNRGRPLMCRALQRLYAERAVSAGLAAQIRQRPILLEPDLRRRGGAREIALEELLTRREVHRRSRVTSAQDA
jgi:predicted transcriptional regulator